MTNPSDEAAAAYLASLAAARDTANDAFFAVAAGASPADRPRLQKLMAEWEELSLAIEANA